MPASKKTAFLFIPGAWCPGSFYQKAANLLKFLGYEATYIDLPSFGEKWTAPGLADDVAHVNAHAIAILKAGKDLVLVGNSYGGCVAQECSKHLINRSYDGRLKQVILIASLFGRKGQTPKQLVNGQVPIPEDHDWIDAPPADLGWAAFFGSLEEKDGLRYGEMLREQSVKALIEPLSWTAWEEVPMTMVVTENDATLRSETQLASFEEAVKMGAKRLRRMVLEDGDHVPMLSMPGEIVEICLGVAEL